MNEDVISIIVDEADRRTVQNIYDAWKRSIGYSMVVLLPESAGLPEGDLVKGTRLSSVPRDFLKVLKEKGIAYIEI
jgi:transcriptional regulator of met regulon